MEYGEVYEIDLDSSRVLQVLKLAGWHENRNVDISELLSGYSKAGYSLNEYEKSILAEFYGLMSAWFFRWEDKYGELHIGGYDYTFDLEDIYSECDDEKVNLPDDMRFTSVPLLLAGYHQFPGVVWSNKSNSLIRTSELTNKTECFVSAFELLEYDLNSYIPSIEYVKKLYVTFGSQSSLRWDIGENK